MGARDWLLKEPRGITHVIAFIDAELAAAKRAFVLPACWLELWPFPLSDPKKERRGSEARRRLRRRLRPVPSRDNATTCVACLGLGFVR